LQKPPRPVAAILWGSSLGIKETEEEKRGFETFAVVWRLPLIAWQTVFFLGPLLFMVAMSFFLVKNYRMREAFEFVNWTKMLGRNTFWDAYGYTLVLAVCSTVAVSLIAFPALCFGVQDLGDSAALGDFPARRTFFHQLSGQNLFLVRGAG
jgi:ABC-type Fe3+ transport system permease subunit